MTTQLVLPPQPQAATLVHHVSWQQFQEIDRAFRKFGRFKVVYLDGTLEIMTVSDEHEYFKSTIGRLLEAYLEAQDIRFYRRGGPTMGSESTNASSEPDESYNLHNSKPHPDLVIEVVITSGGIDKLEGYRRLNIAEVWFWEDGVLDFYMLRGDRYEKGDRSELLPELPIETFCRYITYHDQHDAVREFRQALR
jgi:Uma2 family endonuclease